MTSQLDHIIKLATTNTVITKIFSDGKIDVKLYNHFAAYTQEGVYP